MDVADAVPSALAIQVEFTKSLPTPDIPSPHCEGMSEHPSAAHARERLRRGQLSPSASPLSIHLFHGLAYTSGSALGYTPPSTVTCLHAFSVPNAVGLTAGARAWSKHAHRSTVSSESVVAEEKSRGWWDGAPSGPVAKINERALALFCKVMNSATWRNLHWLPHAVLVYEVRVAEGYGMRWSQDRSTASTGVSGPVQSGNDDVGDLVRDAEESRMLDERPWIFRGFVEPMMKNGHEVGWRH